MKKTAKLIVARILGMQVKRLRRKNEFKTIGVVGSVGKTSTKIAIAKVLGESLRVQYQEGNYNDLVTVPLIFFGLNEPSLFNPLAWLKVFINIEKQLRRPYPYDAVVLEIGTDSPGQIAQFGSYLHLDIAVLTAISHEHMEFFGDLNGVAKEELSVSQYSDLVLINSDLSSSDYLKGQTFNYLSYGKNAEADYHISKLIMINNNAHFSLLNPQNESLEIKIAALSMGEVYSASAAIIVAEILKLSPKIINEGVGKLKPFSGRMQQLKGVNGSLLIDETYNSSPEAIIDALDAIYRMKASQKIAVLGNMNELGEYSKKAHEDIGNYCDPKQLDLVITIGKDANKYLAAAATERGCNVLCFNDPYSVGRKVKEVVKNNGVVLFKGSQNGVFLEEALKMVLEDPKDVSKLVRQSPSWIKQKSKLLG